MKRMTTTITTILTNLIAKPAVGSGVPLTGGVASLMSWVGILSPIVGLLAGVLGLVVAYYHIKLYIIKIRKIENNEYPMCDSDEYMECMKKKREQKFIHPIRKDENKCD